MSHRQSALGRPSSGKKRLKDLLVQRDNRLCADCGAPDPKWASSNIGVFLCLKCCAVHRSLGTHISKVLSVTLDEWSEDEIDAMMEVGGNASANSIYEAYFPEGVKKPRPDAPHEERTKYIRSKYELQEFLKPSLRIKSGPSANKSLEASLSGKRMNNRKGSLDNKKVSSMNANGVPEFIGNLKVRVLKGTNLAIRDMLSSDPYIILTLGQQKVQTSVVTSNLNPVWNEELDLAVPNDYGSIKLVPEIDIQPMITSALAFGDAAMFGDMQIGKWLKSYDNALIEDSTVNIVAGKVKQDLWLRLQNVESGEVELELEWTPLD
ncbi:UNVERIFIED_CONTAM: ADP-ribosylation factor GTPase-activating protein AGD12 [Sesamum latifolium]|uniref:ADP-ribosylation factor GTPase-activating protein AGD12 n=1 Tax=Sesamum latifolium TaxID=2727402 RepID=A0AAW2TRG3_9LAMI